MVVLFLEGAVEIDAEEGPLVVDAPEEVFVLAQAQAGKLLHHVAALGAQHKLGHFAHHRQVPGLVRVDILFRALVAARSVGISVHGVLHGVAQGTGVVVVPILPNHHAQHVPALGIFYLGIQGLNVFIGGIHAAQGVAQVGDLGYIVPDAVIHALDVVAVAGAFEEDVFQLAVVHGGGIAVAHCLLVSVAVPVEGQAEVHHLVRDALLAMENIVDGLCTAAAAGHLAAIQRGVVVRRIALVVGHHVDVVNVRQHAKVIRVLAAVGGRVGEDLVRHGFAHFLEQRDKVLPVGRGGAVHVVAVLGSVGGILPVNVEAVHAVLLANLHALVHEGLALLRVAGHLGPAVGILAPAAHLEFHLELRVLGLVGHKFLHQRNGLGINLNPFAGVLVHKAHVAHVDVGEVAHLFQRREEVRTGVLGVVYLDDGSNADAREALGVVDDGVHGVAGVRHVGTHGGIRVKGIASGDGAGCGLGIGIRDHHAHHFVGRAGP